MMKKQTPTEQAYSELQLAFDHYNQALFDGQLPQCLLTLQRSNKRTMAYYCHKRFEHSSNGDRVDEIAMNPIFFATVPPLEIMQSIVHEMCHEWQWHFGTPSRSGYHNAEWADKMVAVGLMPSTTGGPGGNRTGQHMSDYAIPGSPFDKATAELFASGFAISWADREIASSVRPVAPPIVRDTQSIADAWAEALAKAKEANQERQELDEEEEQDDFYSQFSKLEQEGGMDLISFAFTAACNPAEQLESYELAAKTDGCNRVKYTCPCCRANTWGKPGMKILCGEDSCKGVRFVELGQFVESDT